MDIGPSTSKCFTTSEFSKLSAHKTPIVSDDKSNFGVKKSSTFLNAKRPRISTDDYDSSFIDNTKADGNTSSQRKDNDGILRRVTNTVSGLFSNSSWSEWLKGSSPSTVPDDRQDSFYKSSGCFSSNTSYSSETRKEKHLNQLYPEEGIVDTIDNEVAGPSTSGETTWGPLKNIIPPFKEDQSFMASTPSLSPYLTKRGNEDLLGDPLLLKPSTSNFHSELLPPRDDPDNAVKHTFKENRTENYNCQTNGSINSFPSSRKRLRESGEGEVKNGDINESVNKKRLTQSQMFTEDPEESVESVSRKRPRFSISTFGSPLYSKMTEDEPSFSIFYPGKIMYGGASNHHRKRNKIIPRKVRPRTSATVSTKDDDHSDGGLSSAARRILDCIDKISTPLSDSKRAFQFSVPKDFSFNSASYVADFHKNHPNVRNTPKDSPPVTKLLTPSKVKITKNFSSLFAPKSDESEKSVTEPRSEMRNKKSRPDNKSVSSSIKTISQKPSENVITKENKSNEFSSINADTTQNSYTVNTVSCNISSKPSSKFDSSTDGPAPYKVDAKKSSSLNYQNNDSVVFTKVKENFPLKEKNSTFDNVDYKFSNPAVVSDLSLLEILPNSSIEFKFRQPINEDELTSLKENSMPGIKKTPGFNIKKNKWDCDTCLLQNEDSNLECVACKAPKPQKAKVSESATVSQNWGSTFKKPIGSWECESCYLQNMSEQENCVACLTAKPKREPKNKEISSDKKAVSYSGSWGEAFKRPEGTWECQMCNLQNKPSVDVCASCESPKSSKNNFDVSNSAKPSLNNWGKAFKPSEGSWVCESCLVRNTSNCSNCLCCKSAKPSEKESKTKSATEMSTNVTATQHKNDLKSNKENTWICPDCSITNTSLDVKCTGCKYLRSNPSSNSPNQSKVLSFPSQFLKGKDEWECETCCVRNKNIYQKCQSCDTPRTSVSHSDMVSEALTGNFKFDANSKPKTNDSLPTFKFGTATDAIKEKSSGFSFGVIPVQSKNEKTISSNVDLGKPSGFGFGINTTLPKGEKSSSSSNLDVNSSNNSKSGFTFGVNSSKDIKVSFGVNSSNDIKPDAIKFGVDATPSNTEKSNTLNIEANTSSTKAATTGGFSFSVPASTPSDFNFGVGSPLSKDSSGTVQLNNPLKSSNDGNSSISNTQTLQPSSKEPSKSTLFDITGMKSSDDSVTKPATSSVLQVPLENKAPSSTLQSSSNITSSASSLPSSNLIFGVTPVSSLPIKSPNNASDPVSTTATSATSFSFFKSSVPSLPAKPGETATGNQESKSKPIFQFSSTLSTTQNSGTKFEFPKLDNSSMKNPNDIFSQVPKVNPSNFNFFGNSSSTQSLDNKTSIPSFGDSKIPSFGETKSTSSLFLFGNNDIKPQNAGFSFGKPETNKATPTVPSFGGFGSSSSEPFKFGQFQQEPNQIIQNMNKNTEIATPSSFNFNVDQSQNPFNPTSSVGSQKPRVTKKAHRRLKS